MLLRTLSQRCRRLSPLLAAPAALLLSQGQAKAVLTYNIFESGGDVVVQTSGSLNLTGAGPGTSIGSNCAGATGGLIFAQAGAVCTGPSSSPTFMYNIAGPITFSGPNGPISTSNVSGLSTFLFGNGTLFGIGADYIQNTPIVSSATFNNTTLATLGFTTMGLIGTWTFNGTSESIQVVFGPPAATVPSPLPLFGAAAAFGWSRRLRKRIAAPLSTPPHV